MRRPVVLWVALFASGIVIEGILRLNVLQWLALVAFGGAMASVLVRRGGPYGGAVVLVIVAIGGWWHAQRQLSLEDGLDRFIHGGPVILKGVVAQFPETTPDRTHYVVHVDEIRSASDMPQEATDGLESRGSPRAKIRVTVMGPPAFKRGEVVQVRAVLERPTPATNPGAFDYKMHLARQGITAVAYVRYPRHATAVPGPTQNPSLQPIARMREAVMGGLQGAFTPETAGLLAGIAVGDRRSVPEAIEDDFRRAGISHLLAVSGMHVGFVAVSGGVLLRAMRTPGPLTAFLASALVWLYVFVTGARPPAIRAGVASGFGLVAIGSGGRADGLTALAAAALLLVIHNPFVLYDVSFQLSFVATAAIIVGYAPLHTWLRRRLPGFVASVAALAVAAQWGVLPLLARTFYEVSTVGLVAGLLAAPFVAVLVPLGLGTALLYNVWAWGAQGPAWIAERFAEGLVFIARSFSSWPWAFVDVPRPNSAFIGAVWGFGIVLARGANWAPRRRRQAVALVALLLVVGAWSGLLAKHAPLELVAIDVGQGDALFIRTATGVTVLVDGGGLFQPTDAEDAPNTGTDIIIPYFRHRGERHIDVVVNTHPHEDHLQGLLPVLQEFDVKLAVDSGQTVASPSWRAYLALMEERGVVRHVATAGDVIWLDADTRLEVLHPIRPLMSGTRSDLNNNSVVIRLVHKETAALLTGDIEVEAQLSLLRSGAGLRAHVVKVPHHGSRLGLVTPFYEAVGAGIALITVGGNSHGHPSPELIAVLRELGAEVYRTDVHGMVRLVSDGRNWRARGTLHGK